MTGLTAVIRQYDNVSLFPLSAQSLSIVPVPAPTASSPSVAPAPAGRTPRPPTPTLSPALAHGAAGMPPPLSPSTSSNGALLTPFGLPPTDRATQLPKEVWLSIFAFLHFSGSPLAAVSQTCTTLRVWSTPLRFRSVSLLSPPIPPPPTPYSHAPAPPIDRSARFAKILVRSNGDLASNVLHARLSARNPRNQLIKPPQHLLNALELMTNLEELELQGFDLTDDLFKKLARSNAPELAKLTLTGCQPPRSADIDALIAQGVQVPLRAISIDNVMKHTTRFEDLLKVLLSTKTESISLLGKPHAPEYKTDIPEYFVRRLSQTMPHHTLHYLEIEVRDTVAHSLGDFFTKQNQLRHLVFRGGVLPKLSLLNAHPGALPHLEKIEGPVSVGQDSAKACEILARGRGLKHVVLRTHHAEGSTQRMKEVFEALQARRTPLETLCLSVPRIEPELLEEVGRSFPLLKELVVKSRDLMSEAMVNNLPALLAPLCYLKLVHFGSDPPLLSANEWSVEQVRSLVGSCARLRTVRAMGMEWVCLAKTKGKGRRRREEWVGYSVRGRAGRVEEIPEGWDREVGRFVFEEEGEEEDVPETGGMAVNGFDGERGKSEAAGERNGFELEPTARLAGVEETDEVHTTSTRRRPAGDTCAAPTNGREPTEETEATLEPS